ncbi:mannose-1-phosphate guanylyltransferase [Segetibacter koreensis]|uniref:mannose-1-phosphate guanylyltransferase n=1 Tax=Segetibacter koreensis TaxID=398037 RepID=UPI0003A9E482|nr:mannose-1-phosphate guanylyltransferase [Segetibacter koreensis]
MNKNQFVAIIAGGIGSRFWPKSRVSYPKQFLDILNTGKTLIQYTFERFQQFIPKENIYIITLKEYSAIVKEQLPEINEENIVSEPSRKNTAPCIAFISFKIMQTNPDATLIIAPADHLILDNATFEETCKKAFEFVHSNNALVTLGIKPTYPNTGYGYIQHEAESVEDNIFKVRTFTEKPNLELAKTFLLSGDFLWNAGIFIWKVSTIINKFETHQPEIFELFSAEKEKFNTEEEKNALDSIYPLCTSISIDYAIMEKADNVYVIPSSFGWSDLGTWTSAYDNLEKDYLGNAIAGDKVMVIDSTQCMISAPHEKLLVLQGLNNFIVVDTEDVLLICKKEKEQEIKEYVAEVKRNIGDKYL